MAVIARPGSQGPLGYQQITSLAAATALTIPAGTGTRVGDSNTYSDANTALIQAETQDVRWRDDGTSPTASVGMVLKAGADMWYSGDLNKLKFIETTASAKLNVSYYTSPQF